MCFSQEISSASRSFDESASSVLSDGSSKKSSAEQVAMTFSMAVAEFGNEAKGIFDDDDSGGEEPLAGVAAATHAGDHSAELLEDKRVHDVEETDILVEAPFGIMGPGNCRDS